LRAQNAQLLAEQALPKVNSNSGIDQEIDEAQQNFHQKNRALDLESQNSRLASELQEAKSQIVDLEGKLANAAQALNDKTLEVDRLSKENEGMLARMKDMQGMLTMSSQARKDAELLADQQKEIVASNAEELHRARSQAEEFTNLVDDLKQALATAKQQSADTADRLTAEAALFQKERDELLSKLQSMQEKMDALQKKLTATDLQRQAAIKAVQSQVSGKRDSDKNIDELRAELEKLKIDYAEAVARLESLEGECAELENAAKERDAGLLQLSQLKQDYDKCTGDFYTAERHMDDIKQSLEDKDATISKLTAEIELAREQNRLIRDFTEQRSQEWEVYLAKKQGRVRKAPS